jgi:hypothetical protein
VRKTIVIILILLPVTLFAQINKYIYSENNNEMLVNLISEKHKVDSSGLRRYQSVTFGLGVSPYTPNELRSVLSLGISHQLSKSFFLEVKFDYSPKTDTREQIYIFSGIPQFSFNLVNNYLKLKTGLGLFLFVEKKEGGFILPVADTKLEYSLSKEISIYPEIRVPPFLFTFHISYNIPL